MRIANLVMLATLILTGCASTFSVKDQVLMDGQIENWQTYAWAVPATNRNDPQTEAVTLKIRGAIEDELALKGYKKTSKGRADFLMQTTIFAHFEADKLSDREKKAILDQQVFDRDPAISRDNFSHEHGEGYLQVLMTQPDGQKVWESRLETVLDYRGHGLKKLDSAIRNLLANFPTR